MDIVGVEKLQFTVKLQLEKCLITPFVPERRASKV